THPAISGPGGGVGQQRRLPDARLAANDQRVATPRNTLDQPVEARQLPIASQEKQPPGHSRGLQFSSYGIHRIHRLGSPSYSRPALPVRQIVRDGREVRISAFPRRGSHLTQDAAGGATQTVRITNVAREGSF